jgi:hypothetical protein
MKIKLCMAATAAALVMAAAAIEANATLIPYTFSSDASMTFAETTGSDVIKISGKFTVDTTAFDLQSVDVSMTCSGPACPAPLAASTTGEFTSGSTGSLHDQIFLTNPTDAILIAFGGSLDTPATILLATSDSEAQSTNVNGVTATSVAGEVTPAVPEPKLFGLVLLVGVLGYFLLTRWAAHRANRSV